MSTPHGRLVAAAVQAGGFGGVCRLAPRARSWLITGQSANRADARRGGWCRPSL